MGYRLCYSPPETARLLRIKESDLGRLCAEGILCPAVIGGVRLYERSRIMRAGRSVAFKVFTNSIPPFVGVYTYLFGNDQFVKIGRTDHLRSRFQGMRTMSPIPVGPLGVLKSNVEAELHKEFADLRLHGEWFKMDDRIRRFIKYCCFSPTPIIGREPKRRPVKKRKIEQVTQ